MSFLQAQDLFAKIDDVRAVRIERGCGSAAAIVDGIDHAERVTSRKNVVKACGPEILANSLQRRAVVVINAIINTVGIGEVAAREPLIESFAATY